MKFLADLHIHSHLSRATSKDLTLEHLHGWAQRKGISVVGTGDFTHPRWFAELREKLVPAEPGLFALRPDLARSVDAGVPAACRAPVRFLLSVEVSSIYKRGGKVRKVHNLAYAPDFEVAARIAAQLARIAGCEDGLLPLRFGERPAGDVEEERRLLYVGMTRAKSRLLLTRAERRVLSGTAVARAPSPFLEGPPRALFRASRQPARRRRAEQLSLL